MSGHSKWSTIKHKKAALDSKRGKVFGQVSRMIRIAVKDNGSGDAAKNPALRVALDKARSVNMPKANIDRAIEKGLGRSSAGTQFEEITYEGFGPQGVGLMIRVITDNRNRTGAEVRNIIEKAGGSLGGPGSVSYMLSMKNDGNFEVIVPIPVADEGQKSKVLRLIAELEGHDDVEQVAHNMA